jgi:pimeloyl-ACP methyl ester carboxylesterase
MSGLMAEADNPRAVIVALHGGGTTSAYFDCPGRPRLSLLRSGPTVGFTVLALDRPGYGTSALYPQAVALPEQRIELVFAAINRMLGDAPRGAGVFLLAHSAGCELALRMAADETRRAELLGLSMAGTGQHYHPSFRAQLTLATLPNRPAGLRELLWEPAHLYPADVVDGLPKTPLTPPYEVAQVEDWPEEFERLAARVRIPVLFSVAEHENIWQSDKGAVAQIAAMFSATAWCSTHRQRRSGHNLSLGWTAAAYHMRVFSFAEECVTARERGGIEMEAG